MISDWQLYDPGGKSEWVDTRFFSQLEPLPRRYAEFRWGFIDGYRHTLGETAAYLGLSRERCKGVGAVVATELERLGALT